MVDYNNSSMTNAEQNNLLKQSRDSNDKIAERGNE